MENNNIPMMMAPNGAMPMYSFQQPMMGQAQPVMAMNPYMVYNQPIERPQMTQGLDPKEIAELKKNGNGRGIIITQEDMYKAYCTHRDNNALECFPTNNPNNPGEVQCRICGAKFTPLDNVSQEQVVAACEDFHNLLHTMKILNVDISPKTCRDIFQILPIVDKTPELYKVSADRFNRYSHPYEYAQQVNPYMTGMNLWNGLVGPQPMMGQQPMMMGQPMMGMQQPMMQPMMAQQPMMGQPMMQGQPMQMMGQPMMNQQAMMMTQNAPGVSNGFGVSAPPITVTPTDTSQQPPVQANGPQVTKKLQA